MEKEKIMSFIQPGEISLKWALVFIGTAFLVGSVVGSWITLLVRFVG